MRFRNVVDNYQTTSHTPEALYRLVECYLSLGIPEEAQKAAAVLGANYPGIELVSPRVRADEPARAEHPHRLKRATGGILPAG